MSNGRLVYYDLQAESCGWLFKSPLAGGWGILCRPHYRPHSLFCLFSILFRGCSLLVTTNASDGLERLVSEMFFIMFPDERCFQMEIYGAEVESHRLTTALPSHISALKRVPNSVR